MEEVEVRYDGRKAGTLTAEDDGLYTVVRAACRLPEGALYRLTLCGARGSLTLGVLEPEGGVQTLCRRMAQSRVRALGALKRGEAVCSFGLDGGAQWQRVSGAFFSDAGLQAALEACPGARWRGGEVRELALPFDPKRPFPLVTCFCLARVGEVDGEAAVFYRFRGDVPLL